MPMLSMQDIARMQEIPTETCGQCDATTFRNYCRECDEFFDDGHEAACPRFMNHLGHRITLCYSCRKPTLKDYCKEGCGLVETGHTDDCPHRPCAHNGHTRVDNFQI